MSRSLLLGGAGYLAAIPGGTASPCYLAPMTLTRRRLLASSLLAAGTLPLTRIAHGQPAHRLTVLHMNDFHSRHEAVDGRALTCSAERPDCFGGSARLATAIRAQRAAAEADGRTLLLLDAGDQFQGSLFFTAHRGMAELAVMREIGTDAMAAGNHEFDMGPGVLGAFVDAAHFPVLSANVDASAEPALAGRLQPYAILERAGLRIGLIGLTTQQTEVSSSPGPHVRFNDPGPAQPWPPPPRAHGQTAPYCYCCCPISACSRTEPWTRRGSPQSSAGTRTRCCPTSRLGRWGRIPSMPGRVRWWCRRELMAATSDGWT